MQVVKKTDGTADSVDRIATACRSDVLSVGAQRALSVRSDGSTPHLFYRESAKLRFPASDEEPNWTVPKASSAGSSWKKRKEPSVRTVSSHAG